MSIVRENLLKHANYTPYCGADRLCSYRWPRTTFNGSQFQCRCGWESNFEPEFIAQYRAAQAALTTRSCGVPAVQTKLDRFLEMVRLWVERDGGDMDKALSWMYANGVATAEAPSKCEFPLCAVHHICDRNCERNAGARPATGDMQ